MGRQSGTAALTGLFMARLKPCPSDLVGWAAHPGLATVKLSRRWGTRCG